MTPLAFSGSDHESSMVVPVIPREVRFSGFVGAGNEQKKRVIHYNKPISILSSLIIVRNVSQRRRAETKVFSA